MFSDTYKDYLDVNSLVKPQKGLTDSGNGVMYSSIAMLLYPSPSNEDLACYRDSILKCFNENNILMRTPNNTYGQESWDDYLGLAVCCLTIGEEFIPEHIMWSLVYHLGFMWNTENKSDIFKSWLVRFPIVWVIMMAASFKWFRFIARTILNVYFSLVDQTINVNDGSGIQLQFLQLFALSELGNSFPLKSWLSKINAQNTSLSKIMATYYDPTHPIVQYFKTYD